MIFGYRDLYYNHYICSRYLQKLLAASEAKLQAKEKLAPSPYVFSGAGSSSQSTDSIDALSKRVGVLEGEKAALEKDNKHLRENATVKFKDWDRQMQELVEERRFVIFFFPMSLLRKGRGVFFFIRVLTLFLDFILL